MGFLIEEVQPKKEEPKKESGSGFSGMMGMQMQMQQMKMQQKMMKGMFSNPTPLIVGGVAIGSIAVLGYLIYSGKLCEWVPTMPGCTTGGT